MSHASSWRCLKCREELGIIDNSALVVRPGLAVRVEPDGRAWIGCFCGEARAWVPKTPRDEKAA